MNYSTEIRPATMRRTYVRWGLVAIGLGLAYAPTWLPRVLKLTGFDVGIDGPPSSILWNAVAVLALVAFILGIEKRRLASIRIVKPTAKDLEWALFLFGCAMLWTWLAQTLRPQPENTGTAEIVALPILVVIALILSSSIFEEVLYRGYPIERLTELTGRRWLAVAITMPLFIAPHLLFFGPEWLLYHSSGTIAIYILYIWRRNLVACMVLHLAINLPILIPTIASRVG